MDMLSFDRISDVSAAGKYVNKNIVTTVVVFTSLIV